VDVERFGSHHRTNPHRLVVRKALYDALRRGLQRLGIAWADCHREDRGDGVLVLVPSEVAKSLLVESLPGVLAAALAEHNSSHDVGEQIRLRMAVHAGEVHYDNHGVVGDAVNHTYRLIDAPALKSALAESTGTLAVITSNWFFDEVVRHCHAVNAASYRQVRVWRRKPTRLPG
jgi:class 3 adenylate cyclase